METKKCTVCKKIKYLSEFYRDSSTSTGLKASCKICHKIAVKKYRSSDAGKKLVSRINRSEAARKSKTKYKNSKHGKLVIHAHSITEKRRASNRQTCKNYTDKLPDKYIISLLRNTYGLLNPSQACIKLKRTQVQEIRLIKQLKKEKQNANK